MIKIHLSRILGEKRISQRQLSRMTDIDKNVINAYYNEYIERINVRDLDKLCRVLNCYLSDLIEYIPDKE